VYRNNTRPFEGGAAGEDGVSLGDSWSLRSVTSGASSLSAASSRLPVSADPSVGSADGATDRTPPALAWKVFREAKLEAAEDAEAEGEGAGVGYE
jgi:hypothetical protein